MSDMATHWTTRLYPGTYRRAFAQEVSAVIADVEAERGRWAGALEKSAVIGHALRLRTRLDSARPAGRLLARAVPVLVAVTAPLSLSLLIAWCAASRPHADRLMYAPAAYAPWCAVLFFTLIARWTAARLGAGLALLGALVSLPLVRGLYGAEGFAQEWKTLVGLAVAALLVLLAPPDLPPVGNGARWTVALVGLALAVPLTAAAVMTFGGPQEEYLVQFDPRDTYLSIVPQILVLPTAIAVARSRRAVASALALMAALPLAFALSVQLTELQRGAFPWWALSSSAAGLLALPLYGARMLQRRRARVQRRAAEAP
ncbi:hypothetical protein ACIQGO_07310 [Streptomyces shenzhenensis]|uniref:hypothetical protein n=1 Tax=Streptomyces shenzhenensis TaxID=943815 RepID=UPI003829E872